MFWVHRSRGERDRRAWLLELGCLRRAKRSHPYRAGLHGCFDLHDTGKDHSAYRWRFALLGQAAVGHQDIRGRRRDFTVDAVVRCVYTLILSDSHQDHWLMS